MPKKSLLFLALVLILAGCGESGDGGRAGADIPDLTVIDAAGFADHIAGLEDPAVVNVWASWCLPCRSEAPLLNQAHAEYGDRITFIGVDVQDSQTAAKEFLAEYGLDFDHFFDRDRSIPNSFGAIGTPITMFFAPQGELVSIHNGVIDERTLALNIDELIRMSP